nr:resuscitation-promoting factor [Nocardioides sp. zg-1230]
MRGAAAGTAAAALALTLVPGSAAAEEPREAVAVRLKVADQPPVEVATVPRAWPGELLESHGVAVDGNDLVDVVRDGREVSGKRKRLRQGDVVRLTDVVKERTTKRQRVRAGTVEVPTTKLKPGRRKVVREGRPGVRKVVAVKTLHNGEPAKYRVVKRKLVKDPRPRRVLVGRKAYAVTGADGLNWGALANCESGGNPKAVNPAGYYGLYQFDLGTWRSVGGSGVPTAASAGEQTYRAKLLYKQRGRSPWPNCGRLL